jgi:hypothetical protein
LAGVSAAFSASRCHPAAAPPRSPPLHPPRTADITTSEIETGLAALGTTWAQTNFNTTPSTFIMTLYTADNRTLLGFVYDAFSAPPQLPVIKGESVSAAGRAGGGLVAAAVFAAALLLG